MFFTIKQLFSLFNGKKPRYRQHALLIIFGPPLLKLVFALFLYLFLVFDQILWFYYWLLVSKNSRRTFHRCSKATMSPFMIHKKELSEKRISSNQTFRSSDQTR